MMNKKERVSFNESMIDKDVRACKVLLSINCEYKKTAEIAEDIGCKKSDVNTCLRELIANKELCNISLIKGKNNRNKEDATQYKLNLMLKKYTDYVRDSFKNRAKPGNAKKKIEREKKAKLKAKVSVIPRELSGLAMGNISYESRANGFRQGGKYVC